jgi:hypothetical protein
VPVSSPDNLFHLSPEASHRAAAIASSSQLCFYSSSPLHLPVSSPGNLCRCPHQIICSISPLRQATGPPPSPLGSAPSTMRPSLRLEAGGPSTPLTVSWGCSTPRTGTAARPPSRSCCRAATEARRRDQGPLRPRQAHWLQVHQLQGFFLFNFS